MLLRLEKVYKEMSEQEGVTVKKSEDFSEWYTQVVLKSGLADYAPVKGCMIIRPYGYSIWEKIREIFDGMIKETGVRNAYFPLFIPERLLKKEAEHFEGFTPEVAWVTMGGKRKLEEKLAVRPTSETIMYETFSKWIRSWRDLPFRVNQWCNIVRWETKATKLFLRTREFLWQEGHTCHATKEEADEEVRLRLEQYEKLVEEYLAIPVIAGKKSEGEKFAGALYTTTLEAMMPDGRALQMATSHHLGQNFSKAFGIKFLDKDGKGKHVWQTSWGLSTRTIGALVMVHGDDKGLVLPPRVAPYQVVIVPIYYEKGEKKVVLKKAKEISKRLRKEDIRSVLDDREEYTPGWKFNEWELKGVPLRIEIGPKDVKNEQVVLARRDNSEKKVIKEKELIRVVKRTLEDIQKNLFKKAKKCLEEHITLVNDFEEFKEVLEKKRGFLKAPWCGELKCEEKIKEETGATVRVIPFEEKVKSSKCFFCGKKAKCVAYFAKAY